MNQPLDKGRIMAAVEYYQAKENGQPLYNADGSPKMKPKWWAIGEVTKWQGDHGPYNKEKIYCTPIANGPYEQRTFWDSDNQSGQQPQNQAPQQPQQNAPQAPQQPYGQQTNGY